MSLSDDIPANPLDDMYFLDGYLEYVFTSDDASDGAWFQMCVDTIETQWPESDAHETFMAYLEWREKNK